MLDRLKKIPEKLLEIWKKWTKTQRTIIISAVAVFIVAVGLLAYVLSRPDYQVLTTCKDYTELSQVTTLLNDNNYEYTVDDNTLVVKVKKADLTDAKMVIATANIKSDGYSWDDAMKSSFTTTESDKNKQMQHYLESQFQKDLESMDGIDSATVHVDLADDTNSFYKTTSESSVSVIVSANKEITEDRAENIAMFLATSLGNSSTKNVTIISSTGESLFSGSSGIGSGGSISATGKLKYKSTIENTTIASLRHGLLAFGTYDDAIITMNLDLNWDTVNKIATEYSAPEGMEQGLYETSYELSSIGNNGVSGTPGTTSNDSDDTTYNITNGTNSSSEYTVKEYKYLPNQLVTTTTSDPGAIVYDTSSVAVTLVKNVVYNEDDCKKLGYLDNMTWEEFKSQNAASVQTTVDNSVIDNISKGTGINTNNISVVAYEKPWFEDSQSTSIFKSPTFWVQIALAAAILGLLVFVVIRSARPLTVEEKEPELSVEEMLASTKENQPVVDDIDIQEKSETRKAIEKFVDENPEAVALLLRNWLNDGWN